MENLITIGKIVSTQGHRGEVRVLPYTDFPERFQTMKEITVSLNGRIQIMHPEKVWQHKKFIIIKFEEVHDMNQAELLRDALILISPEQLNQLPEGTYYIFQIVGLEVYTEEGRLLGKIKEVLSTGSNDVYIIERENQRDLLIPAIKQVIKKVDVENKKMVVELMEGLE
ncbi:MAG: ribosome maturation factor RimM [Clostridia bacterium]|nr:ribosome maturation factor RimM [Clostridia bacterium]